MQLPFFPHPASYQIKMVCESPFPADQPDVLEYEIGIQPLKKENGQYAIEVLKSDLLINNEDLHEAYYDILSITSGALKRVVVQADETCKGTGILNFPEVISGWKAARQQVEDVYEGEDVTEYLDEMQKNLQNPDQVWKALQKNHFYLLFFDGLNRNFDGTSSGTFSLELVPGHIFHIPVVSRLCRNETGFSLETEASIKETDIEPALLEEMQAEETDLKVTGKLNLRIVCHFSEKGKMTFAELSTEIIIGNSFSKRIQMKVTENV